MPRLTTGASAFQYISRTSVSGFEAERRSWRSLQGRENLLSLPHRFWRIVATSQRFDHLSKESVGALFLCDALAVVAIELNFEAMLGKTLSHDVAVDLGRVDKKTASLLVDLTCEKGARCL